MKKAVIWGIAVIVLLTGGFLIYSKDKNIQKAGGIGVDPGHPFLKKYQKEFEDHAVIHAAQEDVNNDGKKDLLVVYHPKDDKDNIEFIISGSKNGNYGYAIYRLEEDLEIRDLFSEDMDNCC